MLPTEQADELSIGGDPDPAAVAAEGMRNRSNDSDLTNAILEHVAPRGFTAAMWELRPAAIIGHAAEGLVQCVMKATLIPNPLCNVNA
jgi:hypothetical protein